MSSRSNRSHRDRDREWYQRQDDSRNYQDNDRDVYDGRSGGHGSASYQHEDDSDQYSSRQDRQRSSRSRHDRSRSRSPSRRRDYDRDRGHWDARDSQVGNNSNYVAGDTQPPGDNYQENRYDEYAESGNSQEWCGEPVSTGQWDPPNNTLMLKGLPVWVEEHDIMAKLAEAQYQAREVRLMRRRETGESRGFAFVEFESIDQASQWMEYTQGFVDFGRGSQSVAVVYSLPKEGLSAVALQRNDWMCTKCGVNNFRRRDACFKCGTNKEDCEATEMIEEISLQPTNTLLLRNLTNLTTEEKVLSILASLTALPIKSVKVLRDQIYNLSRGLCAVELHTTAEASQLFSLLSSITPPFAIDGRDVALNYGRRPPAPGTFPSQQAGSSSMQNSNTAASAALAAAQWTNSSSSSNVPTSTTPSRSLGNVIVNSTTYPVYPTPDMSKYQYEPTSGYYYDSTTGFYYDANTHYYYNPTTLKYCYWDATHSTYLPAPDVDEKQNGQTGGDTSSDGKPVEKSKKVKTPKAEIESGGSRDKVKVARTVAKDMERWAKALNQKKDAAKFVSMTTTSTTTIGTSDSITSPSAISSSSLESSSKNNISVGKISFSLSGSLSTVATSASKSVSRPGLVAAVGVSKEPDSVCGPIIPSSAAHSSPTPITPTITTIKTASDNNDDDASDAIQPPTTAAQIEVMITREVEQKVSWDSLSCLLCKRKFASKEQLQKHVAMSDLHKTNISTLRTTLVDKYGLVESQEDAEEEMDAYSATTYRDRAKERRLKFGQPEHPVDIDPIPSYSRRGGGGSASSSSTGPGVPYEKVEFSASTNLGGKMMKAMGWSEGEGLGRRGKEATQVIQVEQRGLSVGLGYKDSASVAPRAGEKYKDAVKRAMAQRYKELNDG